MTLVWKLGAIVAACGVSLAQAQQNIDIPSDVGVALSASPTGGLVPGARIDLAVSATNYGPERVDLLELESSDILNQFVFVHGSSDCSMGPVTFTDTSGNPTSSVLRWLAIIGPPYLEVGATIQCHFAVTVSPRAPFNPSLTIGFPFFADLNEGNDTATVQFAQVPPSVVSVPASSLFALLLQSVLLIFAALSPNYSFKRTAVTGCGTIRRYAAAAA
jgi:hypothetical protein